MAYMVLEQRECAIAPGGNLGRAPESTSMRVLFKATRQLLTEVTKNLERPHAFAAERVGFLICRVGLVEDSGIVVLAHSLHNVADEDYLDDPSVGAMMGPNAIRKALQAAYSLDASMFHVHLHGHSGRPNFSRIDEKETARFVPDFWNVQLQLPHGAIVLSHDSAYGKCWIPGQKVPVEISQFSIVGVPMERV
jgi:hypothetical protein